MHLYPFTPRRGMRYVRRLSLLVKAMHLYPYTPLPLCTCTPEGYVQGVRGTGYVQGVKKMHHQLYSGDRIT